MWWVVPAAIVVALAGRAHAAPVAIRCEDEATTDFTIDGLLDDWKTAVLARDGGLALRCAWDGTALALSLDIADDRVVRVRGKGDEDHVTVTLAATGGKPIAMTVYPGNAIARPKYVVPAKVAVGDSLQPKGFSIELRVPGDRLPGFSASTPALDLRVAFHDSDAATGGHDQELELAATIELGDRKDLLDDFLKTVRLRRSDIRLDTLAELDPDRRGKERLIVAGTVIGVLTEQFAFVSLPATTVADIREVTLLPLGPRGQQIVSALVRQAGNGGSRDLLMLWTVWSGQLQPLVQIEVRKELGKSVLASGWRIVAGKQPELRVEPHPAVGFTAASWNEEPASDADPIVLPWDPGKGGVAYELRGAEIKRRDLPSPKRRRQ